MTATTLSDSDIERAAGELERAYEACLPCIPPALATIADGSRTQLAWTAARVGRGARRTGWKIGATNAQSQEVLGAAEPMFGALLDDTRVASGARCQRSELIRPLCEAELAFRIGDTLRSREPSTEAVLAATSGLAAAIEIVDSRVAPQVTGPQYVIADCGRAARYVLGKWIDPGLIASTAEVSVTVSVGGTEVGRGDGSRVLGDPARAVAWLAGALADQGLSLERGDIVLAGTLVAPIPIAGGETIDAAFSEPLGNVSLQFT